MCTNHFSGPRPLRLWLCRVQRRKTKFNLVLCLQLHYSYSYFDDYVHPETKNNGLWAQKNFVAQLCRCKKWRSLTNLCHFWTTQLSQKRKQSFKLDAGCNQAQSDFWEIGLTKIIWIEIISHSYGFISRIFSKYFYEKYMNKSDPKYLKEACKSEQKISTAWLRSRAPASFTHVLASPQSAITGKSTRSSAVSI
jgi:hypothetical protein